jgi:hypothetical protein
MRDQQVSFGMPVFFEGGRPDGSDQRNSKKLIANG